MLLNPIYKLFLWLVGWKAVGKPPKGLKKFMVTVVPHTSNWDFILGIAAKNFIGLSKTRFLAKKALFTSPIGFFFRWLGGIPVDRNKKMNLVEQVTDFFDNNKEMSVALAPEGSRSKTESWKTGFYHIALKAKVPIMLGFIDYHKQEVGCGKAFYPTGDWEADLLEMKAFYKTKIPRFLEKSDLQHDLTLKKTKTATILSFVKPILKFILLITLFFLAWNYSIVSYGLQQGYGQLEILYKAEKVAEFLDSDSFPEKSKQKLQLIQEIRTFAFDSLGLDYTDSYTKMYDQKGQPILWLLTACKPFELEAKKWHFPVFGTFSYKGFFDKEKTFSLRKKLKSENWDTNIREVNGWSTLGILNDPILSNMLRNDEGDLANLIIHELTHGTLFIKDNLSYNENLASFVGNEGAKQFLESNYGINSEQYQKYENKKIDREEFTRFILAFTKELDFFYKNLPSTLSIKEKQAKKADFLATLKPKIKEYTFINKKYYHYFDKTTPNNTYFMSYKRYKAQQNKFKQEFENDFQSDFKKYMAYLKKKYPSLF